METISQQAAKLSKTWQTDPRWKDTERTYSAEDVVRLRGTIQEEFTLARHGAERLRKLLAEEDAVTALGALTGNQAVQQVRAGLKAIYLSGWQVAADANLAGQTYPDQSLYRSTRCLRSCAGSTTRYSGLTRSPGPSRKTVRAFRTGSPRSSPTPKPGSAAC